MAKRLKIDTKDVSILEMVKNFNVNNKKIEFYNKKILELMSENRIPDSKLENLVLKLQSNNLAILKTIKVVIKASNEEKGDELLDIINQKLNEYG